MSDKRKFPYQLVSASISGGYHDFVSESFRADTHFVGHHNLGRRAVQGTYNEGFGRPAQRRLQLYAGTASNPGRVEAWDLTLEDNAAKVTGRQVGDLSARYDSGYSSVVSTTNRKFRAITPNPLVVELPAAVFIENYYGDYIVGLPGLYAHYTNTSGTWEEVTGIGPDPGTQASGTVAGTFTNSSGTTDYTGSVLQSNTGSAQGDGFEYNRNHRDGEFTEIGTASDFNFVHNTGEFSIAGWMTLNDLLESGDQRFFMGSALSSTETGFSLAFSRASTIGLGEHSLRGFFARGQSGVSVNPVSATGSIIPGKLHHFVVTAEGGGIALYIDGEEEFSGSYIATVAGDADRTLYFGASNFSSPNYAPCSLYEVSFASASWTPAQVLSAYSGGVGHYSYYNRVIKDLPGVVSHWTEVSGVDGLPVDVGLWNVTASIGGSVSVTSGSVRRGCSAVDINGSTSNFVDLGVTGTYSFLHDGSDYTFATWTKWDDFNGGVQGTPLGTTITAVATLNGPTFLFSDTPVNNRVRFFANYGGSLAIVNSSSDAVRSGWHHLAATRSGSLHSFYLDGELVGTATQAASVGSNSIPLRIGRGDGNGASLSFDGRATEVTIASASWSADDVFTAYASGAYNEQHGLGAVHHFPLASGTTDVVRGLSGSMVGTINYGPFLAGGQFGSWELGTTDRIEVAAAEIDLDWNSNFTLMTYMSTNSTTNSDILNNKNGGSIDVGVSLLTVTGVPWFRIHDNSGNGSQAVSSGGSIADGNPRLIACVCNWDDDIAEIHVVNSDKTVDSGYLDISSVIPELSGSVDDMHVGYKYFSSPTRNIGSFSMYDRALTVNEILRLHEWYDPS